MLVNKHSINHLTQCHRMERFMVTGWSTLRRFSVNPTGIRRRIRYAPFVGTDLGLVDWLTCNCDQGCVGYKSGLRVSNILRIQALTDVWLDAARIALSCSPLGMVSRITFLDVRLNSARHQRTGCDPESLRGLGTSDPVTLKSVLAESRPGYSLQKGMVGIFDVKDSNCR